MLLFFFKFSLTCAPATLAGQQEIVSKLQMDVGPRRLYVLTTVGSQPIIVTFLLYAVIAVEPPLADVGGGTEITLTVEGILSSGAGAIQCQFAEGLTTDAAWLSPARVACRTPAANATSEGCAGEALELQLGPGLYTNNRVPLRRVATPSVLRLSPPRGYYARAQWVRVEGYGFLSSAQLSCRFFAGDQVCARRPGGCARPRGVCGRGPEDARRDRSF